MTFTDIIVSIILVLIFGGAIYYIIKSKRSGKRCIGCPDAGTCGKKECGGNNSFSSEKRFKVEREKLPFDDFMQNSNQNSETPYH